MTSEEEKAEAARRKRDAYFAELAEEEKRVAKKKPRRGGAVANVVKPAKAPSKFPVGLKKTNLAMPAKRVATDAGKATETKSSDTPGAALSTESEKPFAKSAMTTITGIPPPPAEPYPEAETEDARQRTIRFAAPVGGGGGGGDASATRARVQIRLGIRGTVAGPVVEV